MNSCYGYYCMKAELSPYYYPTDIVLIDDDEIFLEALSSSLSHEFVCKTFIDPIEALRYVNNQSYRHLSTLSIKDQRWQENIFSYISNKQSDPSKKSELSVVVVDYDMPVINGIKFCARLKSPVVRKILLTGCASSKEVVTAFNNNIIDYYIDKNSDDLLADVQRGVTQMQKAYFRESLQSLMMSFIQKEAPFFLDSGLANFFDDTCISLGVKEYYFKPETSRFILHSPSADTLLMVADDNDIDNHLEIIREEEGPSHWIDKLLTRQYLPFFNSHDGFYTPETHNGSNPFFRATTIIGRERNYYCALVPNSNVISQDFSQKK
ncbi:MAG: CheY-like chemotaxis protein [Candidatus Endobugula sp.]|jgi:CheY-like chemotaxis protein